MSFLLAAIIVLLVVALVLKLAFPLPSREDMPSDPAVTHESSNLADEIDEITARHPGKTGIHNLQLGLDAFAMRMALARSAERTIDVRYYIWEDDLSGRMLLAELIAAADRGVRVRILIDDNPTAGLDWMWAAANEHPNIAVRIFNPLVIRKVRVANYLFDFPRLNRRMHNKSMTADGAAAVVGGRNVGDVYFGAADQSLFIDLDVLAIGEVVPGVLADFQHYWDAEASYPAERILAAPEKDKLEQLRSPTFDDETEKAVEYREAASEVMETQITGDPDTNFEWTDVLLVSDDPIKALGKAREEDLVASQLAPLVQSAETRFDLVSGYFVPGDFGSDLIVGLANRGVETRVVTNSIQVTDVPVVHAGYVPYRKELLKSGVKMYEAKPMNGNANDKVDLDLDIAQTRFSGGGESVHAKTFAIDNKKFFVGSFNFDPRSARLNCEMGMVIDSPTLAQRFNETLDGRVKENTYQVALDDDKKLNWTEHRDGSEVTYDTEPGTGPLQRTLISILSILPIKWML